MRDICKKKAVAKDGFFIIMGFIYFLWEGSSATDSFFRPFALLDARTLRPLAVDILSLKPCLFFLFLFEG